MLNKYANEIAEELNKILNIEKEAYDTYCCSANDDELFEEGEYKQTDLGDFDLADDHFMYEVVTAKLAKLATYLDKKGFTKLADILDETIDAIDKA